MTPWQQKQKEANQASQTVIREWLLDELPNHRTVVGACDELGIDKSTLYRVGDRIGINPADHTTLGQRRKRKPVPKPCIMSKMTDEELGDFNFLRQSHGYSIPNALVAIKRPDLLEEIRT